MLSDVGCNALGGEVECVVMTGDEYLAAFLDGDWWLWKMRMMSMMMRVWGGIAEQRGSWFCCAAEAATNA